ncbi:glycosyltransferase family 4 protein [Arenibacter sp. 6A1]|uniref:glycosyltransferase n=1 Tax=Arenibacter sp. 6A1 TaxID=2720391 RepID=UPI00144502C3|nr:glycosyltransferase [Arenibacter sp. 6A1]NKI26851.1 glycosyltransferase family 4 protein [Arenibacter sp. 6A1]
MKEIIYISLPKNISFSVFEALKRHTTLFERSNKNIIYLSRNKEISDERIVYFNSWYEILKFLAKQKHGDFYGITVFEVLLGTLSNLFGNKKIIIFWVQGLVDHEDFLSYKVKWRYWLFNMLLKIAIKCSDKLVVVTKNMFTILVNQYSCKPSKKHIVINCTSRVNFSNAKKIEKSLCYIGGLSSWQNIDKVLSLFNELLNSSKHYSLHIATFDHVKAKELIYRYVEQDKRNRVTLVNVRTSLEVEDFLSKMEYGFLIRDNILLNNVASPIKLAEYLACGVNPIISDSLVEFKDLILDYDCGIVIENENNHQAILKLLEHKTNSKNAINLYNTFFTRKSLDMEIRTFLNDN